MFSIGRVQLGHGRTEIFNGGPPCFDWEPYLLVTVDTPVTRGPSPDLPAVTVVVGPSRMTWSPLEATPRAAMVVGIAPVTRSPLPELASSRADCRGGKHGD